MKSFRLFCVVAAFLASATLSASAAVPTTGATAGEWTQAYQAAVELAAKENIPILLNFTGSDWCFWCKLMDRQVFSQQEWKDWAKGRLALVFIDFPKDSSLVPEKYQKRNQALQRQYGVRGYPTYILLASDGKTVLGQLGASRDASPADFIAKVEALLPADAPEAPTAPATEKAP